MVLIMMLIMIMIMTLIMMLAVAVPQVPPLFGYAGPFSQQPAFPKGE